MKHATRHCHTVTETIPEMPKCRKEYLKHTHTHSMEDVGEMRWKNQSLLVVYCRHTQTRTYERNVILYTHTHTHTHTYTDERNVIL